jgi:hypothetical protein
MVLVLVLPNGGCRKTAAMIFGVERAHVVECISAISRELGPRLLQSRSDPRKPTSTNVILRHNKQAGALLCTFPITL